MKDMLAKKFKREKEMENNMKANEEDTKEKILIKMDKFNDIKDRKKT